MFPKSATKSRRPVMACSTCVVVIPWKQARVDFGIENLFDKLLLTDRWCLYRAGQNHGDQRNSMGIAVNLARTFGHTAVSFKF